MTLRERRGVSSGTHIADWHSDFEVGNMLLAFISDLNTVYSEG